MSKGKLRLNTQLPVEFIRYVLAGIINTGLSYGLYLLILTRLPYQAAYAIAYVIGIGVQFLLHIFFVYRVPPNIVRFSGYPVIHVILYGFGAGLLYVLVNMLEVNSRIAALIVIFASIPVGFLLTRTWLVGHRIKRRYDNS